MGVLETVAHIVELGATPGAASPAGRLRADFQARTGAFSPDDPWYEERIRAFWTDAVTSGRLGHDVERDLDEGERRLLPALDRAHRGLFRAEGDALVDVWSGAELLVGVLDEASRAEVGASSGQVFDARVVGRSDPFELVLLPGAVFHPRDATACIEPVLAAARERALSTTDTLDALLRMQRTLRKLSRVKAAYAYRPEALSPEAPAIPHPAVRRTPKSPM